MKKFSTAVKLALTGTAVALLLATVVSWMLLPNVAYDPAVALTFASTVAILFTAAYAADNLREFRRATEAEFTPVIDWDLRTVRHSGKALLEVRLINLGRGTAAGIEAAVWWSDDDLVAWIPHRLGGINHVLRSGEETADSLEEPWMHLPIHKHLVPDSPQLVLQLQYRDPYRCTKEKLIPFEIGRDRDGLPILTRSGHPVPQGLRSVEGKQTILDDQLKSLTEEFDLAKHGLELTSYVDHRVLQAAIVKDGQELWRSKVTIERPVYHTVEWVREVLSRKIAEADIPDASIAK